MPLLAPEPATYPEDLLDLPLPAGPDAPVWWVLHTRPRAEKALARRLLKRGVSFFLPLYERQWQKGGRRFCSCLPVFAGYVFLQGQEMERAFALGTNLVARTLTVTDQRRLHDDLVRVQRLLRAKAPLNPESRVRPGTRVEITQGPFAGVHGKVMRVGKHLRFFVEVEFLQRAVSVEIDQDMLEPIREVVRAD